MDILTSMRKDKFQGCSPGILAILHSCPPQEQVILGDTEAFM